MRCLNKLKQTISYKTYVGRTQIVDADGLRTGQYELTYSDLKTEEMNISPAAGTASEEMFGLSLNYAKAAVTENVECDMDEKSIVWLGIPTTEPYNYVVVQKAVSKNFVGFALREVEK